MAKKNKPTAKVVPQQMQQAPPQLKKGGKIKK